MLFRTFSRFGIMLLNAWVLQITKESCGSPVQTIEMFGKAKKALEEAKKAAEAKAAELDATYKISEKAAEAKAGAKAKAAELDEKHGISAKAEAAGAAAKATANSVAANILDMEPEPEPEPAIPEGAPPISKAEQHDFLELAKKFQWDNVRAALEASPSLINVTLSGRWPALHQAAHAQDPKAVEMLLGFGADPLAKNRDGKTPRDLATEAAVRELLEAAEVEQQVKRRQPGPEEVAVDKPRTFSKKLSSLEFSVIVGSRSAPYTDDNDLTKVIAGLLEASKDPKAAEKYGAAAMPEQLRQLQEALTRGMAGIALEGEVSMQLMTNVLFAYTLETFFGGTGYSVLNTSLRNLVEYPAMEPLAKLFHHAVSTLAASDEHGYDGMCFRSMKLDEEVISQYKVEKDSTLNLFSWSGFTSCTSDAATVIDFVDEWDGNTVFVIETGGRGLRPLKLEGEWSKYPEEKEVLWDLGQQFETVKVERTTRAALPALLGLPGGGGWKAKRKEVVVVRLKAVDRFHALVLDLFADGGSLEEAERVVRLRLEREARRHGPESAEVAECWMSLGIVLKDSGEYERALECHRKCLANKLKRVGPEDISLAATYGNMAIVFEKQGDYGRALEHYRKALAIYLKALGPEHPQVGGAYNNMAIVFYKQGEYERALEFYRKALAIYLKALGPEHPDVGQTYGNMANVFQKQGDLDQAMEHYRKALAINEKALGPEHPETLRTVYNMGNLAKQSGDMAAAKALYVRAAEGWAKSLGPVHPRTVQAQAAIDTIAASSPEALAAALPLVREIFAIFDADADGKLSKAEYRAFLRGIGLWDAGDPDYTDAGWDARWPKECQDMESGTDGVGKEGFESILYGKYRAGKAQADLDSCKQARAD
eukprot:COSAG04_NODE_2039_length_4950_cov_12.208617_2_plen_880_part_00